MVHVHTGQGLGVNIFECTFVEVFVVIRFATICSVAIVWLLLKNRNISFAVKNFIFFKNTTIGA